MILLIISFIKFMLFEAINKFCTLYLKPYESENFKVKVKKKNNVHVNCINLLTYTRLEVFKNRLTLINSVR